MEIWIWMMCDSSTIPGALVYRFPKQSLVFTYLPLKSNKALWKKEKLDEQFPPFPPVNSFLFENSAIFIQFKIDKKCCLQILSVWKSLKFVVLERVMRSFCSDSLHLPIFLHRYSICLSMWQYIS